MLLYAQPLSRIVRLTLDDMIRDSDQVRLRLGEPPTSVPGRTSAIRQHVLELPAPVVADALGYHPVTTAKLAAQAGSTFSRYAPVITSGHHQAMAVSQRDSSRQTTPVAPEGNAGRAVQLTRGGSQASSPFHVCIVVLLGSGGGSGAVGSPPGRRGSRCGRRSSPRQRRQSRGCRRGVAQPVAGLAGVAAPVDQPGLRGARARLPGPAPGRHPARGPHPRRRAGHVHRDYPRRDRRPGRPSPSEGSSEQVCRAPITCGLTLTPRWRA
jgi:hypothetical protein